MCRNIRPLSNFEPPATDDEIQAAALQFVRKISGTTKPSRANAEAFDRAVAAEAGTDSATGRVANAGWDRWTPVNALAIGAHLVGSVGQLRANKQRVARQEGVAAMSTLKTLLTAAALGATAYSRILGQRVSAAENPPSKRGTKPSRRTKALAPEVA